MGKNDKYCYHQSNSNPSIDQYYQAMQYGFPEILVKMHVVWGYASRDRGGEAVVPARMGRFSVWVGLG
jgi:hypothetical protein